MADTDAPRGKLTDHLHPLYKDITCEFITNGRHYLSADGNQTYTADTLTIDHDIYAFAMGHVANLAHR